MDRELAEIIIQDYGLIMEQTAHLTFAVPESLLSYEKEVIKEAIKLGLSLLQSDDHDKANLLEVGYITLAAFIPDETAILAIKGQMAIVSGDPKHKYWEYVERAIEISKQVLSEQERLLHEIRALP